MAPSTYIVLLVLLVVIQPAIGFTTNPLDPTKAWHTPHDLLKFNFTNSPVQFLPDVHRLVIAHSRNKAYSVPVLPPQTTTTKPYRWLMLELSGWGQDRIMVAVRQDNLYISAFTDKSGQWYVFRNKAKLNLIPGATVLNVDDDYTNLVGGYKKLGSLPLGREPTLRAVHDLANYQHSSRSVAVKNAVAVMAVTVCEASRFSHISANVISRWVPGLKMGHQANLVVNWKVISCALMVSIQNNNRWGNPKNQKDEAHNLSLLPLSIQNRKEAIATVKVLLWPKDEVCSDIIKWLVR